MGNKYELKGTVRYLKRTQGVNPQNGATYINCNFLLYVQNSKNILSCYTFDTNVNQQLQENMIVELTFYIPERKRWQDPNTGIWQEKAAILVNEIAVIQQPQYQQPQYQQQYVPQQFAQQQYQASQFGQPYYPQQQSFQNPVAANQEMFKGPNVAPSEFKELQQAQTQYVNSKVQPQQEQPNTFTPHTPQQQQQAHDNMGDEPIDIDWIIEQAEKAERESKNKMQMLEEQQRIMNSQPYQDTYDEVVLNDEQ